MEISDDKALDFEAQAAAEGLSLDEWVIKLAESKSPEEHPMLAVAAMVLKHMRDIPPEVMAQMPVDGASQHDHYIYGWPKREDL